MSILALVFAVSFGLVLAGRLFLTSLRFGALPDERHRKGFASSPHYRDGEFRNDEPTPMLVEGLTFKSMVVDYFFHKKPRLRPVSPLPAIKTDLRSLPEERDWLVWFGHSSCLLRLGGHTLLLDPVLSSFASPVSFSTRAFPGLDIYRPEDLPEIDCLLLSHDHWDHLDHKTLLPLQKRIRRIVCPLGVAAHLQRWGFAPEIVHELDWGQNITPAPGLTVHCRPARHFSGRTLTRNKSLWASFVMESSTHLSSKRIYFSGDGGYGSHFADIGRDFGECDLALMECGQYDARWPYVHMKPEETRNAALDVRARHLLPLHAGKFSICNHPWDDPYTQISRTAERDAAGETPYRLWTPRPGEPVFLDDTERVFPHWWENTE